MFIGFRYTTLRNSGVVKDRVAATVIRWAEGLYTSLEGPVLYIIEGYFRNSPSNIPYPRRFKR
jgi:hypothetical protein